MRPSPPTTLGTPANFEDVSDESTLALSEVLSAISTEDAALVNQIRRFRGPWLLSRADDHDHKILTASKTFVADMKYAQGALVGHNCKKLQGSKRCAVNDSCNKQLSAAFRNNEDVHVVLRNYDGENQAFGNSLTVLVLRDASGTERRSTASASSKRWSRRPRARRSPRSRPRRSPNPRSLPRRSRLLERSADAARLPVHRPSNRPCVCLCPSRRWRLYGVKHPVGGRGQPDRVGAQ